MSKEKIRRLIKELKNEGHFEKEMYLAQRRIDEYARKNK